MKEVSYRKIILKSKSLIIRPYKVTDYKLILASNVNRLAIQNKYDSAIPTTSDSNLATFNKRIEKQRELGKNRHHFIFGIFHKKTGEYVGQIDLFTINQQLSWGNLGYHIQNQFFGQGFATEAALATLHAGFQLLSFYRIEASMEYKNISSKKVAQKCGLVYEGKRLKFFPQNGGLNLLVYATNAFDFKLKKKKKAQL